MRLVHHLLVMFVFQSKLGARGCVGAQGIATDHPGNLLRLLSTFLTLPTIPTFWSLSACPLALVVPCRLHVQLPNWKILPVAVSIPLRCFLMLKIEERVEIMLIAERRWRFDETFDTNVAKISIVK